MIFDIKEFYSSINKKLLDNSINFVREHVQIKKEDFSIIQKARKSFLCNKEIMWQKENTNPFAVAVRAYDGAEICELIGLFLLNNLANKFDKNRISLYRDDGLALFKDINGHGADKIRKELHQLFKENGLSLELNAT